MPTKNGAKGAKPEVHTVRDAADALYRAALESCNQHERLARVLGHGLDDLELEGVAEVVELADTRVEKATRQYEEAAATGRGKESEEWWHTANALWMGCREYCRRHAHSDAVATRLKKHDAAQLGEIRLQYELEMSARMALKQAIVAYGKLRPGAA